MAAMVAAILSKTRGHHNAQTMLLWLHYLWIMQN